MKECVPIPAISNGSNFPVQDLSQFVDSHSPVEEPHGQSWSCAVEHCACVKADNNNHDYAEQMSEIKEIKVF